VVSYLKALWRYDKSIPLGTKVPRYFVPEAMVDGGDAAGFVVGVMRGESGDADTETELIIRLSTPTVS
jgi:hypothetical protein